MATEAPLPKFRWIRRGFLASATALLIGLFASILVNRGLGPAGRGTLAILQLGVTGIALAFGSGMQGTIVYAVGSGRLSPHRLLSWSLSWSALVLGLCYLARSLGSGGSEGLWRIVPILVAMELASSLLMAIHHGRSDFNFVHVMILISPVLMLCGVLLLHLFAVIAPGTILLVQGAVAGTAILLATLRLGKDLA